MRTYRRCTRPLAQGLRLLCALAVLLPLAGTAEAQQRRYLLELGAGGHYQTFGDTTEVESSLGGFGRVGLWLPYNFSVELEGSFVGAEATDLFADTTANISTRMITGSLLYNIMLGGNTWAHLKVGGGTTDYGDSRSRGLIANSSGTMLAGAGVNCRIRRVTNRRTR